MPTQKSEDNQNFINQTVHTFYREILEKIDNYGI